MKETKEIHIVFKVLNFIFGSLSLPYNLSPDEERMLIALARHYGPRGIYPSNSTLAKELKRHRTNIIKTVTRLEEKKLITVEREEGKSNHYNFRLPCETRSVDATTNLSTTRSVDATPSVDATGPVASTHKTRSVGTTQSIQIINTEEQLRISCARTRFDEFWKAYPRKKDKVRAQTTWMKNQLNEIADLIIADVTKRIALDACWQDKQFIPYPATYLTGKRWEDEITTNTPMKTKGDSRAPVQWYQPKTDEIKTRSNEQTQKGMKHLDEIMANLKGTGAKH